jgi:DNA-binding LacI/PurR family transcriptional regulator
VGRTAARLLFNLIKDLPAEAVTLLPTEIIIRRSCGCLHEMTTDN